MTVEPAKLNGWRGGVGGGVEGRCARISPLSAATLLLLVSMVVAAAPVSPRLMAPSGPADERSAPVQTVERARVSATVVEWKWARANQDQEVASTTAAGVVRTGLGAARQSAIRDDSRRPAGSQVLVTHLDLPPPDRS